VPLLKFGRVSAADLASESAPGLFQTAHVVATDFGNHFGSSYWKLNIIQSDYE
jgi:hypothetical protein